MATVTLGGNPIKTSGDLPKVGTQAPNFQLVKNDLSIATLSDFKGTKLVLNIFPSIDTATCATSVRTFNAEASKLENVKVLCISRDLPFNICCSPSPRRNWIQIQIIMYADPKHYVPGIQIRKFILHC